METNADNSKYSSQTELNAANKKSTHKSKPKPTLKSKLKSKPKVTDCESCINYVYDEEADLYECLVNLDEDEMVRFMTQSNYCCPYYRLDDEYGTVRKQM